MEFLQSVRKSIGEGTVDEFARCFEERCEGKSVSFRVF